METNIYSAPLKRQINREIDLNDGFEVIGIYIRLIEWGAVDSRRRARLERFTWGIPECPYRLGNIAFVVEGDRVKRLVRRFVTFWEGIEYESGPADWEELQMRIENWRIWARGRI